MKRLSKIAVAALGLGLVVQPAMAEWRYSEQPGDSVAETTYNASVFGNARGFTLACWQDALRLVFITGDEPLFEYLLANEQRANGVLALSIDAAAETAFDAEMYLRRDGAAVVLADIPPQDAMALGTVGSSLAVSVDIGDQRFAQSDFTATGSAFAVMDVADNCPNPDF